MEESMLRQKVGFIVNFHNEYNFIKKAYPAARKAIGVTIFQKIIAYNITEPVPANLTRIQKKVATYLTINRKDILEQLKEKKEQCERIWSPIGENFFEQAASVAGVPWHHKKYNVYLTASCFWGGDYDEQAPNVYVNPLLKQGDPFYIICHELSHLLFWEFIYGEYGEKFVVKHHAWLWRLSEIMVNYPLLAMHIGYTFPLIVPPNIPRSTEIVARFPSESFKDIIVSEIKTAKKR
jgi:hypothetical protein